MSKMFRVRSLAWASVLKWPLNANLINQSINLSWTSKANLSLADLRRKFYNFLFSFSIDEKTLESLYKLSKLYSHIWQFNLNFFVLYTVYILWNLWHLCYLNVRTFQNKSFKYDAIYAQTYFNILSVFFIINFDSLVISLCVALSKHLKIPGLGGKLTIFEGLKCFHLKILGLWTILFI